MLTLVSWAMDMDTVLTITVVDIRIAQAPKVGVGWLSGWYIKLNFSNHLAVISSLPVLDLSRFTTYAVL